MGREIRRVPKGWQHPSEPLQPWEMDNGYHKYHQRGSFGYGLNFQPLYDSDFETKMAAWVAALNQWLAGRHPAQIKHPGEDWTDPTLKNFADYEGRSPNPDYYRAEAWTAEQATCYQIYETVSEGTPVSPVFETADEMRAWLIAQGHSEESVQFFIDCGWAPSMAVVNGAIYKDIDIGDVKQE